MTRDAARPQSRLEAVAASLAVPETVRQAWTGAAPELAVGQVWRARWGDQVQIVAILGTDRRSIVLPLTFDLDYTDSTTTRIAAEANPFGLPLIAWRGLAQTLPIVVFERFAGRLAPDVTAALALESKPAAEDHAVPHPVRVYRALLEDTMEELAAAQWYDSGSGQLSVTLQRMGLSVQDVADTLGATPQKAFAVWRGQVPLSRDEAETLAPLLGESAETILAANPTPPSDLIVCLEQPARHRQVLAYAAGRSVGVSTAYRDVAYQTWALAARQTGEKVMNWDLRLDTLFAAVLNDR